MVDTTAPPQPAHPHPKHHWMVPRGWSEWVGTVIILLIITICAFGAGRASNTYAINDARQQITILQKDIQGMRDLVQRAQEEKKNLDEKLAATDRQLRDVFNVYRTLVLNGNETTLVSTGHVTVGLVGPPTNDKVSINVNGTPHTVGAGDTIDVGASACRIEVKSFDMFKVTLLTSCTPTKP